MWCLCFSFLIFTLCFVMRHKNISFSGNTPTPRSQWMTFVVVHHRIGKCIVSYRMLIFSVYSGWQQYCVCGHVHECVHAYVYLFVFMCVCVCVFHNTMTKFQDHVVQVIAWTRPCIRVSVCVHVRVCVCSITQWQNSKIMYKSFGARNLTRYCFDTPIKVGKA